MGFVRGAGYAALLAVPSVVAAGITIALFFAGAGSWWGYVNDVFSAIALLLLIPPVIALALLLGDDLGWWFWVISWLAVIGLAVAAAGQLLLVAGAVSLNTSFLTGGIGIVPAVAWGIAITYAAFTRDLPSATVGWLMLGTLIGAAVLAVAGFAPSGWPVAAVATAELLVLCAWLVSLGLDLLNRA